MVTRSKPATEAGAGLSVPSSNEVHLIGRLSDVPLERTLPSEALMCTFSVVVDRVDSQLASRQRVDVLACVVWSGRVRRHVRQWAPGDLVEIHGSLRKRFFRVSGGATGSRVEVEVTSARRLRKVAA